MWSNKIKTIFIIPFLLLVGSTFAQDKSNNSETSMNTVVIDPGHGGKDPGCHGDVSNEKDVVLAIGLKLGEYIQKKFPEINVIYTRKTDVFIELDRRAKIANENDADVFISIHANAASSAAYGTESYVLGLHRTESQQKIAERENSTIHFEENSKEKYADFELTPDAIIARQLQLSVFLNQSINLASKTQAQFESIGRKNRGVKQAGFLVLYKTTMPSLLIESGFLTNSSEEKFLNNPVNQIKMANSIFKAFQEYKSELEGVNVLVENGMGYERSIEKEEQQQNWTDDEKSDQIYFKVQIETSSDQVELQDKRFKGLRVSEYKQDGLFKYTTGVYENDFNAANEYKKHMRKRGFEDAFVVSFLNGERIPISKGIKLSKK